VSALGVFRGFGVVALACASLGACGAQAPADPGTPVAAAALPHPKPGLWQWSSRVSGVKRLCLSGQTLSVLDTRPGCPVVRQVVTRDGSYIVEARCAGGPVNRTYARAGGDFDHAFSTEVTVGDVSDHADYAYLGPCPAGQKPDDTP
jgi:hypothetical protein